MYRLYVQQALAGERAFAKHVLVHLRSGRAVGVDTALPGEQPVVQRNVLGGRQRRDHARLQDAVATHHAAQACVEAWLVVRMRGHAHQLAQPSGWQLGVAVQRDHVGRGGGDTRGLAKVQEGGAAAPCQGGDQQLQLAPLAFPANPALLGRAEPAFAVQQDKTRRGTGLSRVLRETRIERVNLPACAVQQGGVGVGVFRGCVGPVGQQPELRAGLRIGEVVQQQAVRQLGGRSRAGQHAGDHHQHAVFVRDAAGQGQAGQVARAGRLADQAVDHRHHRLGGGKHHQRRRQQGQPCGSARPIPADAVVHQHPRREARRAKQQRAQISRQRHAAP